MLWSALTDSYTGQAMALTAEQLAVDYALTQEHVDEYAVLTNTVLKVKGVPMFYLPVMYYPIQSDDRATGFLLPTYGSSTPASRNPLSRSWHASQRPQAVPSSAGS